MEKCQQGLDKALGGFFLKTDWSGVVISCDVVSHLILLKAKVNVKIRRFPCRV